MITVYTDGAMKSEHKGKSTGMGGWAWWVDDHYWDSGAVRDSTNNRMEMQAVIEALRTTRIERYHEPLLIVSDSAYVVNCFGDDWRTGWESNGWKNSAGRPVVNRDLWERLFDLYDYHPQPITFRHCRGHGRGGEADVPHVYGNARADLLAGAARKTLER